MNCSRKQWPLSQTAFSHDRAEFLLGFVSSQVYDQRRLNWIKNVTIYTEGACLGNPGPRGYAAVLLFGDKHILDQNNEMLKVLWKIQAQITSGGF